MGVVTALLHCRLGVSLPLLLSDKCHEDERQVPEHPEPRVPSAVASPRLILDSRPRG